LWGSDDVPFSGMAKTTFDFKVVFGLTKNYRKTTEKPPKTTEKPL
jgi:hypothetical protein